MAELKKRFGDHCIDFERAWNFGDDEAKEELAMCEDGLLEHIWKPANYPGSGWQS